MSRYILSIILIVLVLVFSCEKPTFNNPFDPDTELAPYEWIPTNLKLSNVSDSKLLLTWEHSLNNVGFKVERSGGFDEYYEVALTDTISSYYEIASTDTTSYIDTGLTAHKFYAYRVYAYTDDNKSDYAFGLPEITSFPGPYNLSAIPLNDSKIQLSWEDSTSYEVGFIIERQDSTCSNTNDTIDCNSLTTIDSTVANTYIDSTVTLGMGNTYVYKVTAYTNYNISNYNNENYAIVNFWKDCSGVWGGGNIEDIDGNCYKTVQIGNQLWMAENLKVTHYNNGDEILYHPNEDDASYDGSPWDSRYEGEYGVYSSEDQPFCGGDCAAYGNFYNWAAVTDNRGICPEGFHAPDEGEFMELAIDTGTYSDGGRLKEIGTVHWNEPNEGATNSSGFTALPGGLTSYGSIGAEADFWSKEYAETHDSPSGGQSYYAYFLKLHSAHGNVRIEYINIKPGLSGRCLAD